MNRKKNQSEFFLGVSRILDIESGSERDYLFYVINKYKNFVKNNYIQAKFETITNK